MIGHVARQPSLAGENPLGVGPWSSFANNSLLALLLIDSLFIVLNIHWATKVSRRASAGLGKFFLLTGFQWALLLFSVMFILGPFVD